MSYFWLVPGLLLPTLSGWLLLRIVERKAPVLFPAERVVAGFVLGCIVSPFAWFIVEALGIGSFSLISLLATQLVLIAVLIVLDRLLVQRQPNVIVKIDQASLTTTITSFTVWQKALAAALFLWFIAKQVAQWILLIGPAFFDDTVKNWNLRAKMFYESKELILETVPGKGIGVGSYPPSVPLFKTWLVSLNGGWHEGLANVVHLLWFLAALVLLYHVLKRFMSVSWALVGTYILSSVPLYSLHGGIAYADQFLSVIVFMAVAWLFIALQRTDDVQQSYLRLSALATGFMIFTKNEALILYVPPMALLVLLMVVTPKLSVSTKKMGALWYIGSVFIVGLPWLMFKWSNSLTFGNAKPITGMELTWHENVIRTIISNTFLMGHWSLLPILFVGLAIWQWRHTLKSPLRMCMLYFIVVWLMQIGIFVFTELYTEAINQTGYARGIVHLIPIIVLMTTVLLHKALSEDR